MSAICVLTPIVIGSWPMIASAVAGVAASMGFSVIAGERTERREEREARGRTRLEMDVPNSEVLAESMDEGQKICIVREGVTIEFGRDERGACTVCVSGENLSKKQLKAIGEEAAGRVVQQFAYNKLMTELRKRNYDVVQESVQEDDAIRVNVRLNR